MWNTEIITEYYGIIYTLYMHLYIVYAFKFQFIVKI